MITKVQEWVEVDNTIRNRREKLKALYDNRTKLEKSIVDYVKKKDLQNASLRLNDGSIRFAEKNVLQTLSQGFVKEQLEAFFEEAKHNRALELNAETVMKYMLSHRKQHSTLEMIRDIQESAAPSYV